MSTNDHARPAAGSTTASLPLEASDIDTALTASDLDWSEIDPTILGTVFERGTEPGKRAQLCAHYTDRDNTMLIVDPGAVFSVARGSVSDVT